MAIALCKNCKKEFASYLNRGKPTIFCSQSCYWMDMKGKPARHKKGSKNSMPAWNKGIKLPEQSGEKHPQWIADRSALKRQDERIGNRHKQWSRSVKNRDGWKCRISNENCEGRMEAHHILGWSEHPELRYELNNGITLCHAHHPKKRAEDKLMIPVFQGLLGLSIGN